MWKQLSTAYQSMYQVDEAMKYTHAVIDPDGNVLGFSSNEKDATSMSKNNLRKVKGKVVALKKPMAPKKGDMMVGRPLKEEVNPNCDCVDCNCDPCECGDWREGMGPEGGGHKTSDAEGLGEETLVELSSEEKKLIDKMYDKKGNLTKIGKAVMDAGKMRGKSPSQMNVLMKRK